MHGSLSCAPCLENAIPTHATTAAATPILRWGAGLLKLDLLSGSTAGRAAAALEFGGAAEAVIAASGNAAIAAAGRARACGVRLSVAPRGVFTHEMRETLQLWGVRLDPLARPTLAPLDSDAAVPLFAHTLGAELLAQLDVPPPLVVCAAGERAALLGALQALRGRWPAVRGVALVAADEELPDLPREVALPDGIERFSVARADAALARSRVARELGLLASHASAAAAVYAHQHGGVALITAPGEREFSLEQRGP